MDLQGCQQNSTIANPNLVFLFLLSLCVWWLIVFVCLFFCWGPHLLFVSGWSEPHSHAIKNQANDVIEENSCASVVSEHGKEKKRRATFIDNIIHTRTREGGGGKRERCDGWRRISASWMMNEADQLNALLIYYIIRMYIERRVDRSSSSSTFWGWKGKVTNERNHKRISE